MRSRRGIFAALAVASLAATAVAVTHAAMTSGGGASSAPSGVTLSPGLLAFRTVDPDEFGAVKIVSASRPGALRRATGLVCERIHVAAGRGICVARGRRFGAPLEARLFGADFRVRHTIPLSGTSSRARVSPDGRFGATTTFVSGHSYATPGAFSTQTTIFEMTGDTVVASLEQFRVTHRGRTIDAPDVNVWGVTFARDSDRFYATLATGGETYLIEGSVSGRTAHTLRENVECPSLSPDGRRLAYKKRVSHSGKTGWSWRLHTLDVATRRDTPLAERRSVDDQVEWLDNDRLVYGVEEQVWSVAANGTGKPRLLVADADSPAAAR